MEGSREIGFTILSMTLSLAAVFIPVLFMGGLIGRLLPRVRGDHRRGDPGLGLRLADADADAVQPLPAAAHAEKHGVFFNAFERFFDGMLKLYEWTLWLSLKLHVVVVLIIAVALLAGTWLSVHARAQGLLAAEDRAACSS